MSIVIYTKDVKEVFIRVIKLLLIKVNEIANTAFDFLHTLYLTNSIVEKKLEK